MGLVRYFIMRRGGEWLVTLEGRVMARCASRTEAIETAATMADLMGAMHYDADVMVEAEDRPGLDVVWAHGRDPVPAAALSHDSGVSHPHVRRIQRGVARSA